MPQTTKITWTKMNMKWKKIWTTTSKIWMNLINSTAIIRGLEAETLTIWGIQGILIGTIITMMRGLNKTMIKIVHSPRVMSLCLRKPELLRQKREYKYKNILLWWVAKLAHWIKILLAMSVEITSKALQVVKTTASSPWSDLRVQQNRDQAILRKNKD